MTSIFLARNVSFSFGLVLLSPSALWVVVRLPWSGAVVFPSVEMLLSKHQSGIRHLNYSSSCGASKFDFF